MKHTNKKKGFTLVELVIVIAVIAILAGVMIATFSNVVDKANKSADLQEVKSSLDAEYYDFIAEGQLPNALLVTDSTVVFTTIPTFDTSDIVSSDTYYFDANGKKVDSVDDTDAYYKVAVTYTAAEGETPASVAITKTELVSGGTLTNTATITGRKGTAFTVTLDIDATSDNFGYYTLEEVK